MAAIWSLPVVFVCENNQYGEYTATTDVTAGDLASRGTALSLTVAGVDGMDVLAVRDGAAALVARARDGGGASLLVCETYRFHGHGMGDPDRPYRTREEEERWKTRDPLERLAAVLRERLDFDPRELEFETEAELEAAVAFASEAPYPEPEEVRVHVFADAHA
jgi:acetoin:2,6-dichlorophenolindophenol oxidoreductase subunit alpha